MSRPLDYIVRPITEWPGTPTASYSRKRAPFKATTWTRVWSELESELRFLGAKQIVVRMAVREGDIRLDGQLRANARASHPGIIVEFDASSLRGQPRLRYACDRFKAWEENALGIARSLNALRLADRYGVTSGAEQYEGFKAIPASATGTVTLTQAMQIIADWSSCPPATLTNAEGARHAVRIARKRAHPDSGGSGSNENFHAVQTAADVLGQRYGVSL